MSAVPNHQAGDQSAVSGKPQVIGKPQECRPITFDELKAPCIYFHPTRGQEQRELIALYQFRGFNVEAEGFGTSGGFLIQPARVGAVLIERVIFYPLTARGERASERPVECSLAEFVHWMQGDEKQ